ncbi:MAG: peptidoglycan DD-metalloendopeptidase family protein [Lachnospiraceae bacterium]|nr:peptidoglycan DD-metalloendopeptidase family protein [Lachnospiraceae bacterium]
MIGVMIQTAFLVIAILAVQRILGEKLHVYIRYGLWLLVALRLLIPINFVDSPFSVLRVTEAVASIGQLTDSSSDMVRHQERLQMERAGGALSSEGELLKAGSIELSVDDVQIGNGEQTDNGIVLEDAEQAEGYLWDKDAAQEVTDRRINSVESLINKLPIKTIIRTVWLVGGLLVGSFLGMAHLRFRRRLCRCRARVVYKEIHTSAINKRKVPVYRVKGLESPCLVGFFRPAIYIGVDVDVDSDTFRYAVAHEEVHYLHRDHIWVFMRAVLVTVYWFHPFVWIAAAASAKDGELACDYGAVQKIGEEKRFAYGEMLLTFSHVKKGKRIYSYGTMLRPGRSELKERILRLTKTNSSRMWAGILTAVFMIILAGCAFTGTALEDRENQENMLSDGSVAAETENSVDGEGANEDAVELRQIEAVSAFINGETPFGADGPMLDYAGTLGAGRENIIIFHDYFGLVVYDLTNRKIVRSLDLEPIGCHMTQGDDACQVAVSADGTTVWLHPRSKSYMYQYEIQENLLYQEPIVKTFEVDLEGRELFDRYLVTEGATQKHREWVSNYLYEEYKDEQGIHSAYIYLVVWDENAQALGGLECVWDDMVYNLLWNDGDGGEGQSSEPEEFPYNYEGVVNLVEIIYDRPCDYSRISDTFGGRIHPVTQEMILHEGIDYVAEKGTDIAAAADGVVYETGFSSEHGNYVVLLHINGDMTYYCHCDEIIAEKDAQVKRGEKIATVGSTGQATGPHLHFALSQFGRFVNPEEYMRSVMWLEEGDQIGD